ncbi:DUF2334 domain-containing protein [Pseudonocardiaceae bacterium YIM PH 21723]|nr:DUF2334 domain-containing protein [Pseudonocardiaceae bacterium YIM PH 21723]
MHADQREPGVSGAGKRLVVSLSGVTDDNLSDVMAFTDAMDRRRAPLSLLVAPRRVSGEALDWIRARHKVGDAVLLHGLSHAAIPPSHAALSGLAKLGNMAHLEFAATPEHEARMMIRVAKALMDRLELATEHFAPPRWLASVGTMAALREYGFRSCATATGLHDLTTGAVYPGLVHGLGWGSIAPEWRRWTLLKVAERTARRGGTLRLAVHADELASSAQTLKDLVDLALAQGCTPITYPALLTETTEIVPLQVPARRRNLSRLR